MSRRHESKAHRRARRKCIGAEHDRIFAPLPGGDVAWEPPARFALVARRGGARLDFVRVGPTVPFDPAIHSPADLPMMVLNELLRQAIPRPAAEPDVEN